MNREILFRGKRIDNGEWINGSLLDHSELFGIVCIYALKHDDEPDCPNYNAFTVNPATVGQFTGLTDKNGKKIFEGDKVHCYGGEYYQGFWEQNEIITVTSENFHEMAFYMGECENLYVIGNIHDTEDTK